MNPSEIHTASAVKNGIPCVVYIAINFMYNYYIYAHAYAYI